MEKGHPAEAAVEAVREVLIEHDIDAEQALETIVAVIVDRHLDVELRRRGLREPYPIHNERADALKAVNDAVHQRNHSTEPGAPRAALQAVIALLTQAQFAAERAAGLDDGDDDDDPPPLRLVRD